MLDLQISLSEFEYFALVNQKRSIVTQLIVHGQYDLLLTVETL